MAAKAAGKKKPSQRDRLKGRTRPTITHYVRVDDDTDARAQVEAAGEALAVARMRLDDRADAAMAEAEKNLQAARDVLAACYEGIVIRAKQPARFEELAKKPEHLPREGKDERWNNETFPRALFLECVVGDMSTEDWQEWLEENCSTGEQAGLFLDAQIINARTPDGSVPKG